jgi:hypothetical protein
MDESAGIILQRHGLTGAERETVSQKHSATPCGFQQVGDRATGIQSLLPMQKRCLLVSRFPKERLEDAAQVFQSCNLG